MTTADAPLPLRHRHPHLVEALWKALALTIFCFIGFTGLHRWNAHLEATGTPFLNPETGVDRLIPLSPIWIWPYLSYYAMCFFPIALLGRIESFRRIAYAYFLEFGACFACFALFPMRMAQPPVPGDGLSEQAVRWLYSIDAGYNIFPSLHTANAFLVAAAFLRTGSRLGPLMLVQAVAIALSTVLVKQHYAIDVAAGLALAAIADRLAFRGWSGELRGTAAGPGPGDARPARPLAAVAV